MKDTKQLTAEQSQALIRYALTIAHKVCHERFCDPHPMGQAEVCKATLEAIDLLSHYDTTARKEAREAERGRLTLVVHSLPATAFTSAGAFKESAIKAIEAAANNKEGGGDGR